MCKKQAKDYNLLRPFDLEEAKRGDFVQTTGDDEIGKFVAENASEIVIDFERSGFVIYEEDIMSQLRMKPLCWVEGRPVYKGDVLWHRRRGKIVASHMSNDGEFLCEEGRNAGDRIENITWTPPKVKREGWVNIYPLLVGEQVASVSHAYVSMKSADRKASPDRIDCVRIEWEE